MYILNLSLKYLPNIDSMPHADQMMRLRPTDPTSSSTPFGDTKIPEPEVNRNIVTTTQSHTLWL